MESCIVTAYFELNKSKKNDNTYKLWMKNMLDIDNQMIIFCDSKSYDTIYNLRKLKLNKTIIKILEFTDFYSYRYYNDFESHYLLDTEKNVGHNPYLYMIWSEKIHFITLATALFTCDYYLWVDIGCFRKPNVDFINWPNIENIKLDKILLLEVEPFTQNELNCTIYNLPSFQHCNRIGGTIFGGNAEVMLKWHKLYFDMLEYFIKINRFIGKDQSIINSVYLLNKDLCDLVKWKQCSDHWFYLQDYLRQI